MYDTVYYTLGLVFTLAFRLFALNRFYITIKSHPSRVQFKTIARALRSSGHFDAKPLVGFPTIPPPSKAGEALRSPG